MGRSPVGQGGKGVFDFSASLTANGTERKRAGKNVHLEFFFSGVFMLFFRVAESSQKSGVYSAKSGG